MHGGSDLPTYTQLLTLFCLLVYAGGGLQVQMQAVLMKKDMTIEDVANLAVLKYLQNEVLLKKGQNNLMYAKNNNWKPLSDIE